MKLAVVGATGLVGREILTILEERNLIPSLFIPVASEKSVGSSVSFSGKEYHVISNEKAVELKPDIAIFSAGGATSREWAPRYAAAGTTVLHGGWMMLFRLLFRKSMLSFSGKNIK
jgi:aspartate-semialdehyde dehydrogenase